MKTIYYLGLIFLFFVLSIIFCVAADHFNEVIKALNVGKDHEPLIVPFLLCFLFILLDIVAIIFYIYFVVKFTAFFYKQKHGIEEVVSVEEAEANVAKEVKKIEEHEEKLTKDVEKIEETKEKTIKETKDEDKTEKEAEKPKEKVPMKKKLSILLSDKSDHSPSKK